MSVRLNSLLILGSFLALFQGCSRESSPNRASSERVTAIESAAPGADFQATLPHAGGPRGYVGSDACRSCHEDQYSSWHRSYHRTMTQIASEESVQADFNNVVLATDTTRFTLNKRDGEFWVRMEPLVRPPSEGGPPPVLEQRIGLVTGSHHMQVFWVPEGAGNIQLGFPFTWLIPEKRWVPRNSTFVRPPNLPHHAEVWNMVCSRCHTTGVEPRIDFSARTADTRVAELGISCEACHGPGERHVRAQRAAPSGSTTLQPGEIVHPKKLTAERSAQVCGFCHSMKWIDNSSSWHSSGFQFRPGDDLEETTPIIRPSTAHSIHGLKEYLDRNPEIMRDFFWPDGMVRVSGREFNGVLESPCYKGGQFSCLSCHSLHESDPNDQLARRGADNRACLQCHEKFADASALTAHTHHAAASSGSECYNCHMPHTTYGILKAIRSHQISSPNVAEDLSSGRINACNLCHMDKTLKWTADTLRDWYSQPVPTLSGDATARLSHFIRAAIGGDAGQRVIGAWHLSWPPALAVSGTNWVVPVLAQLLDDPYAAVRIVSERSLRDLSAEPKNYDYTIDPGHRRPAREMMWSEWEKTGGLNNGSLDSEAVLLRGNRVDRAAYDSLLERQNDRPVRLRE